MAANTLRQRIKLHLTADQHSEFKMPGEAPKSGQFTIVELGPQSGPISDELAQHPYVAAALRDGRRNRFGHESTAQDPNASRPEAASEEVEDDDPRTDSDLRAEIKSRTGEKVDRKVSREELLAKLAALDSEKEVE